MNKITILISFVFIGTLAFGQTRPPISTTSYRPYSFKETSRPIADIESQFPFDIAISNVSGDTLNTANVFEKNGKPTVLLFWLTTCSPCRAEMKAISDRYVGWQKEADFNFYAISVDFPRNASQFISRVKQLNWTFDTYHDFNREFGKIMPGNLNGVPQTFVLDKEGKIVHHKRKYRPGDENQLFAWIKGLN